MSWAHVAVADAPGHAVMMDGDTPELAHLASGSGGPDAVEVITLDAWWNGAGKPGDVDFIKLDVEGAERRVLAGGREFFAALSPLVMFELKHGNTVNHGLIEDFRRMGFDIWRLAPGAGALLPYEPGFADAFSLNLFAARPDRARMLADKGLLATGPAPLPTPLPWSTALPKRPYAAPFLMTWATRLLTDSYRQALELLLAGEEAVDASQRITALQTAWGLCAQQSAWPQPEGALLRCRIAHALGLREEAIKAAGAALDAVAQGRVPAGPFLMPAPEYDARRFVDNPQSGLWAVLSEFLLTRGAFSSYFAGYGPDRLLPVVQNPNHGLALDRMVVLSALRAGADFVIPPAHALFDARLSPNAAIWRQLCFGVLADALLGTGGRVRIVDVGASSHGALTEPYAPLLVMERASVTGFEPDETECARLDAMYKDTGHRFLARFVGRGGPATFHETHRVMTLYPPNTPVLSRYEGLAEAVAPKAQHAVQTVALDDLPETADVDLIKIDVQGAELDVFHGARKRLAEALVVWTEVEFLPLYAGQPLFSEVEAFLRELGFTFHSFDHLANRRLAAFTRAGARVRRPQTLWADAIFVRDLAALPTLPEDKLKRYAALMESVVGAADYAHAALVELDRRNGTGLASAYLAGGQAMFELAP